MKNKIVLIIVFFLILLSCSKSKDDNVDYFAFGDAYGMCQGNCANFYLLKEGKIYPDDMSYYLGVSIKLKFKSEALPDDKYDVAKSLIADFPEYLVQNPDKTFGCPDCSDQGGFHIEIKDKGQIKRWDFDTVISNLPSEIQDYVREMRNIIEALKYK